MTTRSLQTPIHLVLDWDGTLTLDDTMACFARSVEQRKTRSAREEQERQKLIKRFGSEETLLGLQNENTQPGPARTRSSEHSLPTTSSEGFAVPFKALANVCQKAGVAVTSRLATATRRMSNPFNGQPVSSFDALCYRSYDCQTTWEQLVEAYLQDYMAFRDANFGQAPVDDQSFREYLASLRSIELASKQRAADSGLFRGLRTEDVAVNAFENLRSDDVKLSVGWMELFAMFAPDSASFSETTYPLGSKLTILSVNWSATYIRHILWLKARYCFPEDYDQPKLTRLLTLINDMDIVANDIHGLETPQGSSGRIVGDISTSADKLRHMPRSRRALREQTTNHDVDTTTSGGSLLTVYVGDTKTDYECLKDADIGLWLFNGEEAQAAEVFKRTFAPLQLPTPKPPRDNGEGPRDIRWCGWVRNMQDVAEFLAKVTDAYPSSREYGDSEPVTGSM